MPSKDEMMAVAQSCSEYTPLARGARAALQDDLEVSCETCQHWRGEEEMCDLDIYEEQLFNLDQT